MHELLESVAGKPVGFRPDPLILDAPWTVHLPKLAVWAVFQASILYEAAGWAIGERLRSLHEEGKS